MSQQTVLHIESLRVKNYRALRDIELKQLKPLTVFLGANGSGKSTLFDIFAFLSECFTVGLGSAWNKRGGLKELRTRGCDGPIEFELKYREEPGTPIITYHLSINEDTEGPFVETEWLQWRRRGVTEDMCVSSIFITEWAVLSLVKHPIKQINPLMSNLMIPQCSQQVCLGSWQDIPA